MKTVDQPVRVRRRILISGAVLLGAVVAAIALYYGATEFVIGRSDQRPLAVAPTPVDTGAASSDSFTFSFFDQPGAVPELRFTDGEGRALSLVDFRNRPVLLNIWATWCVPCRKEMPSLDHLQAQFGASQLLVLPLSIDRQVPPVVKKFYEDPGLPSPRSYLALPRKAPPPLNPPSL